MANILTLIFGFLAILSLLVAYLSVENAGYYCQKYCECMGTKYFRYSTWSGCECLRRSNYWMVNISEMVNLSELEQFR